ncbi:hypothetical protein [Citrifermentans bemidjiense]|uniref:hypothetical protein n=1 Tax=Citrifermentans bemidjiense TaxID=225194 RepID=UPI000673E6E6|nr:hypothetical protein [Citrifermentans bemidjiense]
MGEQGDAQLHVQNFLDLDEEGTGKDEKTQEPLQEEDVEVDPGHHLQRGGHHVEPETQGKGEQQGKEQALQHEPHRHRELEVTVIDIGEGGRQRGEECCDLKEPHAAALRARSSTST